MKKLGMVVLILVGIFAFYSYRSHLKNPLQQVEDSGANIKIVTPKNSDVVSSPIRITGQARVFENVLSYRIRDDEGKILAQGNLVADAKDVGLYGPFEADVEIPSTIVKKINIELYSNSAKDGTEINNTSVSVFFE